MSDDLSKVDWGAEIPMHGNRPDWLSDEDHIAVKNDDWRGSVIVGNLTTGSWKHLTAIRLPADHQCYRYVPRNPDAPSDDIAKRMEALVRDIASFTGPDITFSERPGHSVNISNQARAIVALLPEPVDADLVEARKLVGNLFPGSRNIYEQGEWDCEPTVQTVLAAIRRGRDLERDSREG